jgi:hypothetical protein
MKRSFILASIAIGLCAPSANADGVDLVPYFTRVAGGGHSFHYIVAMMLVFMAGNYALNFTVIGLPAVRFGSVPAATVATGLLVLTLFGQLADRLGALLAAFFAQPVTFIFRLQGEAAWAVPLLILNFLFSGLAVAALAFYFLRRRWFVQGRLPWIVAVAASLITNPAWVIGLWFFRRAS